jgi:hypothetical protein
VTVDLLRWFRRAMDVDYWVRVEFEHRGERLHEFVGPFDRYFAELVCVDYADQPYLYGETYCRATRARIVTEEEMAAEIAEEAA